MIEHSLEQGSDEWLEWRKTGFGASEAGAIMGLDPYNTVLKLWYMKTGNAIPNDLKAEWGISEEGRFNQQHGNRNEEEARIKFILHTGEHVEPLCATHSDYPFLKASFDGISSDRKVIVEIKCPVYFGSFRKHQKETPGYYYAQMQQQLLVSGAELNCFWSYYNSNGLLRKVYPNKVFMDELLRRSLILWESVEANSPPDVNAFKPYEVHYEKN